MKRFFLIDYENVSDSGLDGFFDLTADDTVYLFYTVNACKIGIDFVDRLRAQADCARLRFVRAATGNQALDFQLSSFLGGLIAANQDADAAFFIISKDRGYTCLPGFWSAMQPGVRLSVLPRISEESRKRPKAAAAEKAALPQPEKPAALPDAPAEPQPEAAAPLPEIDAPQPEAASPLPETASPQPEAASPQAETASPQPETASPQPEVAPPQPETASPQPETASEAEPPAEEPVSAAPDVPVEPGEAQPRSSGRKRSGKSGKKAAAVAPPEGKKALSSSDRAVLNSAVQQVLSKARCEPQISNAAASLVTKMYKDGTNKQELYRGIVKSFGREKGLEVYSLIKPVLV